MSRTQLVEKHLRNQAENMRKWPATRTVPSKETIEMWCRMLEDEADVLGHLGAED